MEDLSAGVAQLLFFNLAAASLTSTQMWTALATADWSKPQDFLDYRATCIDALARLDPAASARRLSKMLLESPSQDLATFSAPVLGAERRYEAAPILMRFALLGDSRCTKALEMMKEPRAAFAILWWTYAERAFPPVQPGAPIEQTTRNRLTSLLGKDVGSDLNAWASYYDSVADRLPSPLPKEVANETDQVTHAMVAFGSAAGRLHKAELRLAVRRQKVARGEQNSEFAQLELVETYIPKAVSDMAIAQPNWRVRTTDDLKTEVTDYSHRVDAILAKYDLAGVPSSAPASSVEK